MVANELLVTLKDVGTPVGESWRVLAPGGLLLVTVPDLSALHNCLLLALGCQPTTLHIAGDHVRGFAPRTTTSFPPPGRSVLAAREERDRVASVHERRPPAPLRTYSHTLLWLLQKPEA